MMSAKIYPAADGCHVIAANQSIDHHYLPSGHISIGKSSTMLDLVPSETKQSQSECSTMNSDCVIPMENQELEQKLSETDVAILKEREEEMNAISEHVKIPLVVREPQGESDNLTNSLVGLRASKQGFSLSRESFMELPRPYGDVLQMQNQSSSLLETVSIIDNTHNGIFACSAMRFDDEVVQSGSAESTSKDDVELLDASNFVKTEFDGLIETSKELQDTGKSSSLLYEHLTSAESPSIVTPLKPRTPYNIFLDRLKHPSCGRVVAALKHFVVNFPKNITRKDAVSLVHPFLLQLQISLIQVMLLI